MKDLEKENLRLRRVISDLTLDKLILQDEGVSDPSGGWIVARMHGEKLLSPAWRRRCIDQVEEVLDVSERRVCRVLGQHRSTQCKVPCGADDEQALTDDDVAVRGAEGAAAPTETRRLWLRPEYPGHVWAYDFVEERTPDGRKLRILTIIDEASRECLTLVVSRRLRHEDVLAALADLFIERGPPAHIGSGNGSEFIATAVQT